MDVETTGLEADDVIIQLAILPFEFDREGRIYAVGRCESWLEDPGRPLDPKITALTGLTDELLRGQRIDEARVAELLSTASLVVAHNAGFDRPKFEARFPAFGRAPWACSQREVPWREEGLQGEKLEWLAFRLCEMFYEAHRADADCLMTVHLLATMLPSGRLALAPLLDQARAKTVRIWARSPKSKKGVLKMRRAPRYRWNDGEDRRPFSWWTEVREADLAAELAWLQAHVYDEGPPTWAFQIWGARDRYSSRTDHLPFVPDPESFATRYLRSVQRQAWA